MAVNLFATKNQDKTFLIDAIEIDARKKTIREIKIENAVSLIKEKLGFSKYSEVFLGEAMACLITGAEDHADKEGYFVISGMPKKFYNTGIVVRVPKNYNMERLLKCNITLQGIQEMIRFGE